MRKAIAIIIIIIYSVLCFNSFAVSRSEAINAFCISTDYPYSYVDDNGKPKGLIVDLLRQYEKHIDKKVNIEMYSPEDLYEAYEKNGDILFDANYREYSGYYRYQGISFLSSETAIVIRDSDFSKFKLSHDISENLKYFKTIGIKNDFILKNLISKNSNNMDIKEFQSTTDGFSALSTGSIDVFLGSMDQINSIIKKNKFIGFKIINEPDIAESYAFISKTQSISFNLDNFLNDYTKSRDFGKSYQDNFSKVYFPKYIADRYIVLIDSLLFIMVIIFLILILRKNKDKTRTIVEKDSELRTHMLENKALLDSILTHERTFLDFRVNLSHEFRTPLNLILSVSKSIGSNINNGDIKKLKLNYARYSNILESNVYRMMKLVNNITDINKLENSEFKVANELIDIYIVLENLVYEINSFIGCKKVELRTKINYSEIELLSLSNPHVIRRIILNLVSNSLKHSKNSNKVYIMVEHSEINSYVSVFDDGDGISEKKILSLNLLYNKLKDSNFSENEGSGLGLYLVNSLTLKLGGSFSIINKDSIIKKGRTSTHSIVSIPLLREPYTMGMKECPIPSDEFNLMGINQVAVELADSIYDRI